MEKKRKLPARAAARVEQLSKKRTRTPPERRSSTPALAPAPAHGAEPTPPPDPKSLLPRSIQPGKPLPTVEEPQPTDLPDKDYQSIADSGVLAESLARSRSKWVTEGIFQKYWSKPLKRKGAVIEEPNNPSKETMTKIGQVVITVEPHVLEATMFVVKDPKPPPPPPPPPTARPIIQYGPPNGVMPPPPQPTPVAISSPPQSPAQTTAPSPRLPSTEPASQTRPQPVSDEKQETSGPALPASPSVAPTPPKPLHSPKGVGPAPSPRAPATQPAQHPVAVPTLQLAQRPAAAGTLMLTQPRHPSPSPLSAPANPAPSGPGAPIAKHPCAPPALSTARPSTNGAPVSSAAGKPAPGTDPIILALAEKAGEDAELRDLMKRVAQGDAAKDELERFQAIIDEITAENKRKGTPQGPSADRLLVSGRTVRYFADEVRTILDIVLASNPRQTSADLRPPAGSDPLVVLLVKTALDEPQTRDMVRRIAENRPQFSDATDLKAVLDRLKHRLATDLDRRKTLSPAPPTTPSGAPRTSSMPNGPATAAPTHDAPPQQALRSKGPPPPPPKPDISGVVFEFHGGNGDRYLFPKFSVLQYVPVPSGQQVMASFLIVRKGSASEYPVADPKLDFYEPITIRLYAPTGKHLENLARVVAPQDEVRRYMDDVMDKMTRGEYTLLAMRLPRGEPARESTADGEKEAALPARETPKKDEVQAATGGPQTDVMWVTGPPKPDARALLPKVRADAKMDMDADERYQKFITSISRKEAEGV